MKQIKILKKRILEISNDYSEKYTKLYMDFIELFKDYFKKQALLYIASLDGYVELKKSIWDDDKKFQKKVENLLEQIYTLWLLEATKNINLDLGKYGYDEIDFIIDNEKAVEYAQNYAWSLIVWINETTHNQISEIITKWIKESKTIKDLALEIDKKFSSYSLYRSTLIAQQEVATAFSKAVRYQNDIWTQKLGITGWKRSITQRDSNVRPSHKDNELEGWIPKNQVYSGTWTDIAPHSFNCRCHDEYSMVNPKNGLLYDNEEVDFWWGYTDTQIEKFNNFWKSDIWKLSNNQKILKNKYWYSKEEIMSVFWYTWNSHININKVYRTWKINNTFSSWIKFLYWFLRKTPNATWIFYRWVKPYSKKEFEFFKSLKVWEVYWDKAFLSTSLSKKTAKSFMLEGRKVLFKIKSNYAKSIQKFSLKPQEKEYLFLPKTLFKVEKIKNKDNILEITLKDL